MFHVTSNKTRLQIVRYIRVKLLVTMEDERVLEVSEAGTVPKAWGGSRRPEDKE